VRRLAESLRSRLRDQGGFALPTSLAVLIVVGGLATVTARAAIGGESQSLRDRHVKMALSAANAGLSAAMYRTNLLQPGAVQCVVQSTTTGAFVLSALEADGWCREQGEDLGEGASFTMRVSGAVPLHVNGQALTQRSIVSTGIVNGVRRRLLLKTNAATGEPIFPNGYAAVSLDPVTVSNSAQITGGIGSNGNVYLRNSAQVCGNATPGPGKVVEIRNSASVVCAGNTLPAQESFNLQPVDQGNARTVNDNSRIGNPPSSTQPDPCSDCGSVSWNPTTRRLRLSNSATLTLGGNVYSFCRLDIENTAQLKIAARPFGGAVRVYIDAPEACGGAGTGSVSVRNTGTIVNLNPDPTTMQLYLVGSSTYPTSATFENSAGLSGELVMALYAPSSTVRLQNSVHITGAVAAKQVEIQNSARITWHESIGEITSGSPVRLFKPEHYIECTAVPPTAAPNSGC